MTSGEHPRGSIASVPFLVTLFTLMVLATPVKLTRVSLRDSHPSDQALLFLDSQSATLHRAQSLIKNPSQKISEEDNDLFAYSSLLAQGSNIGEMKKHEAEAKAKVNLEDGDDDSAMTEYSATLATQPQSKDNAEKKEEAEDIENLNLEMSEKILASTKAGNGEKSKIDFWVKNDPDYKRMEQRRKADAEKLKQTQLKEQEIQH